MSVYLRYTIYVPRVGDLKWDYIIRDKSRNPTFDMDGELRDCLAKISLLEIEKEQALLEAQHSKDLAMLATSFLEQDMVIIKEGIREVCGTLDEEHKLHSKEAANLREFVGVLRDELDQYKEFILGNQVHYGEGRRHESMPRILTTSNSECCSLQTGKVVSEPISVSPEIAYALEVGRVILRENEKENSKTKCQPKCRYCRVMGHTAKSCEKKKQFKLNLMKQ